MTQEMKEIKPDLLLENYDYELPKHLIATRPTEKREQARLLVYDQETDQLFHDRFVNLSRYLPNQSDLFFNQSRVFPCRIEAKKSTGAKVEIFVLSLEVSARGVACLLKSSSKKRLGDIFLLPGGEQAELIDLNGDESFFYLKFSVENLLDYLDQYARVPIPPYIRGGQDDEQDREDYQTSYARELGSVAAPTAGLHFSQELLEQLRAQGHKTHFLSLHVGMGTFSPVKSKNILDHQMHAETYELGTDAYQALKNSSYRIAVGTTSLRAMESTYTSQKWPELDPEKVESTHIFIHPGKEVLSIEALITNFHLPKSSLLMLVSALIGREKTLELYELAKEHDYRFFSYGDGMLIKRKKS